jgi:signal transduction histidine kinase
MKLILASRDLALRKLCREIMAGLADRGCAVAVSEPNEMPGVGDFYIWDFETGYPIPNHLARQPVSKRLFLVHSDDMGVFRQNKILAGSVILLKPVTRATLSVLLERGLAVHENREASSAPDCDEMLQCLLHANLKLQEYDQERTNFLARAVHDFRAPLTAISGYCGLLLAEPLGALNDDQNEVLRRMRHSAHRLSRLAADMLQLSVGQRLSPQPNLEKGELLECLEQAMHELAPIIGEKGIAVSAEIQPSPEPLYFERNQMEQVFLNLLENACKFTPKGGSIEIKGYPFFWDRRLLQNQFADGTAERRAQDCPLPNSFRIDLHDSGPGLLPEHLASIFEEYTRYLGTQDRSGGGLGLAICKVIVENHHGQVWAESNDSGAVFSLVLPFWTAKAAEIRNRFAPPEWPEIVERNSENTL